MSRLALTLWTVLTLVFASSAYAASEDQRSTWSLTDMLNQGGRILTETITQGLAVIQDRLEVNATTTPSADGEESTHLHLKLFPSGKSQPDDAIGLEGTFRRSPDSSPPHFGFDLRILPPTHSTDPKEYI